MKSQLISTLGSLLLAASIVQPLSAFAAEDEKTEALIKQGDALMAQNKYKQAEDVFRTAARENPNSAKARERIGALLAAMAADLPPTEEEIKNGPAGKEAYEKRHREAYGAAILEEKAAIKLDEKWFLPHVMLGQIYTNIGKNDDAIAEFKQAVALKPTSFHTHLDLGKALLIAGKLDESITAYRKAIELKPDHEVPHLNLGLLLSYKGNLKEAIAEEERALQIRKTPEAYRNLGNIYIDAGDIDNAKVNFERALKMQPGDANSLSGLGWAQAEKGFTDLAIKNQRKALKMNPYFTPAWIRLGDLLSKSGKNEEAEATYQIGLKHAPKDAGARTSYANFLVKLGRKDQATAEFQKVLDSHPNFKPAKEGLAGLKVPSTTK